MKNRLSAQIKSKFRTRKHKKRKTKDTVDKYFDKVLNSTINKTSIRSKLTSHKNKTRTKLLHDKNLQNKKKKEILVPVLTGEVITSSKPHKIKKITILLDSGASGSIISSQIVHNFKMKTGQPCKWNTMAGSFMTKHDCLINFTLPELNPTARVKYMVHVTKQISKYDMIIGRDILQELGIVLDIEESPIKLKNYFTPMKSTEKLNASTMLQRIFMQSSQKLKEFSAF